MLIFILIAAFFLGLAVRKAFKTVVALPYERTSRPLHLTRGVAWVVFHLALSLLFIAAPFSWSHVMVISLGLVLLTWLVGISFNWLCNYADESGTVTLAKTLTEVSIKLGQTLWQRLLTVGRIIAPSKESWKEIRFHSSWLDFVSAFKIYAWIYLLLLVTSLGFALIGGVASVRSVEGIFGETLSVVIGFNALLIICILTVAAILTLFLCALLQRIAKLEFRFSYRNALGHLSSCIGYGTLAGFFGAALTPITTAAFQLSSPNSVQALSHSVLLELPALGAVVGYFVGLVVAMVSLVQQSTNLIYSFVLVPMIFFLTIFFLTASPYPEWLPPLTPDSLFELVSPVLDTEISADMCAAPDDSTKVNNNRSDGLWLMSFAQECSHQEGSSLFVSGEFIWQSHLWILSAASLISIVKNVQAEMREPRTGDKSSESGEDNALPPTTF